MLTSLFEEGMLPIGKGIEKGEKFGFLNKKWRDWDQWFM